ncbi:hypothetical protein SLA2020_159230 [Shorea laevis]
MAFFQFLLGVVVASLLWFVLLLYTTLKAKARASSSSEATDCNKIIIVGAGVAGAALAYALGKDGRRVHVIERDLDEPKRIAGEVLQPGGYLKLIELGLEDCVNKIDAQKLFGYVFYKDGKCTKVSYPLEKFDSDVAGRGFHNGRFIQRMREKAASLPNVKLEQGTVTSLLKEKGIVKGVQYKNKRGQERTAYAPLTIVCDGGFSNLRRSLCRPKIDIPSYAVGLVLENCELPLANHGLFVMSDPSPISFYPISSTEIRCLVDIPGQKVPSVSNGEMSQYLKTMVAPQISTELRAAFITAIDKGNIRTMQNRSIPTAPNPTPGALLMGDALNMRHYSTAGGMTVALSDSVVLRDLLRPLGDLNNASALCKYLESFYILRKPVASVVNGGASILYTVYTALPDPVGKELQQIVFDYLNRGGRVIDGPVAALACLNPHPWILLLYFFPFAFYVFLRLLLPFPSPKRLWNAARLVLAAIVIIFPIIKSEGIRQTLFPVTIPAYYRATRLMKTQNTIRDV